MDPTQLGRISLRSFARGFNYHYPSSTALARVSFSSWQFPPPFANSDRKCERRERGRLESLAGLPSLRLSPSFTLLFLLSPLSSPIVGREPGSSRTVGRSGISARDRYKTFNGFETHSSTAPRLFASFALPPPRPPTCVVGGPRMPTSEEQNQLWNARFYASRRR